jgi:Protein of unknown function (DUF3040)
MNSSGNPWFGFPLRLGPPRLVPFDPTGAMACCTTPHRGGRRGPVGSRNLLRVSGAYHDDGKRTTIPMGVWPVALSDEEQRLLEQMEAALAAEDPKLVNALRGTGVRRVHRRRAADATGPRRPRARAPSTARTSWTRWKSGGAAAATKASKPLLAEPAAHPDVPRRNYPPSAGSGSRQAHPGSAARPGRAADWLVYDLGCRSVTYGGGRAISGAPRPADAGPVRGGRRCRGGSPGSPSAGRRPPRYR